MPFSFTLFTCPNFRHYRFTLIPFLRRRRRGWFSSTPLADSFFAAFRHAITRRHADYAFAAAAAAIFSLSLSMSFGYCRH